MSSEFKVSKDKLVAALFELSKNAEAAALATVEFFNHASSESPEVAKQLLEALAGIATASTSLKRAATGAESEVEEESVDQPKKKKRVVDPYAPKKPHTMYLAFSSYCRTILKDEREKLGLPPLSLSEMTKEVSERWNGLSAESKAEWKAKYDLQMAKYLEEKAKYAKNKEDGVDEDMSKLQHHYVVPTPIDPYVKGEERVDGKKKEEKDEKKDEKKKDKKEKKEKKKDKKVKKEKKEKKDKE